MAAPEGHAPGVLSFFLFREWLEKERSRFVLRESLEFTLHLPFHFVRRKCYVQIRIPSPFFSRARARAPHKNDRDISYTYEPLKFLPKDVFSLSVSVRTILVAYWHCEHLPYIGQIKLKRGRAFDVKTCVNNTSRSSKSIFPTFRLPEFCLSADLPRWNPDKSPARNATSRTFRRSIGRTTRFVHCLMVVDDEKRCPISRVKEFTSPHCRKNASTYARIKVGNPLRLVFRLIRFPERSSPKEIVSPESKIDKNENFLTTRSNQFSRLGISAPLTHAITFDHTWQEIYFRGWIIFPGKFRSN